MDIFLENNHICRLLKISRDNFRLPPPNIFRIEIDNLFIIFLFTISKKKSKLFVAHLTKIWSKN